MDNTSTNFSHDNIDEFNDNYRAAENQMLNILQWNVRGMNDHSKFDEILQILDTCRASIDVIVIGETWLKTENCILYEIPQYKSIHSCRSQSNGGLAVYIKKSLEHRIIKNYTLDGFHHIQVELKIKGHYFDVNGMYRPPSYDFGDFSDYLEHLMHTAQAKRSCCMFGDVNVPINLTNNNIVARYSALLESYGFYCTNTVPTRPISRNILDHVLCRMDDIERIRNDTIFNNLSDHLIIISSFKLYTAKETVTLTKKIVNHRQVNLEFKNFVDSIGNVVDTDSTFQTIISTYNSILDRYTKIITKQVNIKGPHCPWMTFDLWILRKIKDNYLARVKRHPADQHLRQMLLHISKKVEIVKKACRKSYYVNILTNTPHSKLWKNIKDTFGLAKKSEKICLVNNGGHKIENNDEVCEELNHFFVNIGHNLANGIPTCPNINPTRNIRHIRESIFLRPSTENEVIMLIKNLDNNKSNGPDNIPAIVLKSNPLSFARILSQSFNLIIQSGHYPNCLKLAKVVPVFKSGDALNCNNYRPISTLSVFNKILEKLLVSRLLDFLTKHNVLYKQQYGFRQGCSTLTAITELVDCILCEIDSKKIIGALFLDLKKAFDTLNHGILMDKLECYGIRGIANAVVRSYLCNRKQFVSVDGGRSTLASIDIGVPQGSNIGPLLFLLYINDLANLELHGSPRLFADDTALFYPSKDINTIINSMEVDLETLNQYFNSNLLSLNLEKTKYMIFHSARKHLSAHDNPRLGSWSIEKVDCFKYLGIHLDPTLSWSHHIKCVERRVASLCGIMWRVCSFVPWQVLMKYYFAYIHSHINYLISVWGRAATSRLKKLQTLQNRCLKTIFRKPLLYSTLLLYSDTRHNILPLAYLSDFQTLLFVHDNLHNPRTHHNIQFTTTTHTHMTRHNNHLTRIRAATNLGQKRISFIGPTKFNSLPLDIKSIENRNIFKSRLKHYFKENMTDLFN